MIEKAYVGCLLGTAVGDALGLPYEGISPRRASRLFPDLGRHHLLFGKGMVSDDTEHACLVAQSLVRSRGEIKEFEALLRWNHPQLGLIYPLKFLSLAEETGAIVPFERTD